MGKTRWAVSLHGFGGSTFEAVEPQMSWFFKTEDDARIAEAQLNKALRKVWGEYAVIVTKHKPGDTLTVADELIAWARANEYYEEPEPDAAGKDAAAGTPSDRNFCDVCGRARNGQNWSGSSTGASWCPECWEKCPPPPVQDKLVNPLPMLPGSKPMRLAKRMPNYMINRKDWPKYGITDPLAPPDEEE